MMKGLSRTDFGLLFLRIGLGLTLVFFGAQKMLGVFGGAGYMNTVTFMHGKLGVPTPLAHIAIFAEFFGGLGVLCGLITSVASLGIACTMAVAVYVNMRSPGVLLGIFEGDQGADPSKLFFPGSLCLTALTLLITGPGRIALDAKLFKRTTKK